MIELSELEILKRALTELEVQYKLYQQERDNVKYSRSKKDREHAVNNMRSLCKRKCLLRNYW